MTAAPPATNTSVSKGIAAIPLQVLVLMVKRPFLCIFMALLILWSTISGLAHFNPAVAKHFNNAVTYFGLATVASEASDIWRKRYNAEDIKKKKISGALAIKEKELRNSKAQIDEVKNKNSKLEFDVKEKNTLLKSKNATLRRAERELRKGAKALKVIDNERRAKTVSLNNVNSKLTTFRQTGKRIESGATKRFTKVAMFDAAGEFLGWIPVVGDAASIGLAAAGIYQMCQMFREIEQATTDLGVPYQVYTDTFCEKPAEKSAEVIFDVTERAKNKAGEYVSTIAYQLKNAF